MQSFAPNRRICHEPEPRLGPGFSLVLQSFVERQLQREPEKRLLLLLCLVLLLLLL